VAKFKKHSSFSKKGYKSEFIVSCLQLPKSRYKEINWAKEMKIMNSLTQKNDNPNFWFHARTDFAIPSLAWFLTPDGRKYLNEKFRVFNLNLIDISPASSVYIALKTEKQGEDSTLERKKPKTLMDFIRKKE
jgi:hypothetical protein